ncbi:hypothetical protein [Vibrio scophthalmi]|uniref:Uncharacterized protein n=1 Tax=Vibrio scophthalmi LMG 19158 TaxID=870967 RepID=F9RIX8_9VIBR|nr:hypothetical protein [Vibrio scophthalmi]EGU41740.1 hypothetical protein VIS19158_11109 [Vibrio scophthalmi LMG 19158]
MNIKTMFVNGLIISMSALMLVAIIYAICEYLNYQNPLFQYSDLQAFIRISKL